jgi:uncharacterized protein YjbJ (UPF0337 family)
MNSNKLEGKWNEIKGEIQRAWGELSGDEVERSKGNWGSLVGTIQQKFGETQDDVKDKLNSILRKFNVAYEDTAAKSKTNDA